jgi:hypothetical protein
MTDSSLVSGIIDPVYSNGDGVPIKLSGYDLWPVNLLIVVPRTRRSVEQSGTVRR